jgi:hypothetical protein
MSNEFIPVRVEVDSGTVTGAISRTGRTSRWMPEMIGRKRYWIDLLDADGGRLTVWDGDDEREAVRQAEAIRSECQITVSVAFAGEGGGYVH